MGTGTVLLEAIATVRLSLDPELGLQAQAQLNLG
jgi:hypothetical protein